MDFARDGIAIKLTAAALAFAATFLVVRALSGPGVDELPGIIGGGTEVRQGTEPTATAAERIEALQEQVREAPSDPQAHTDLAAAYLARVGETEDPAFYDDAERSLDAALSIAPNDFAATLELARVELSRHHFRRGLELSLRARAINPSVAATDGAIADAQLELGRYGAAERTLERYADRSPELASYSRISYFRELNGDHRGAVRAMELAASAAGARTTDAGFAQTLLGDLRAQNGDYTAAERNYEAILALDPNVPDAQLGLAAIEAGRGDFGPATRRQRAVLEAIAAPDHAILLGETEEAAGDLDAARSAYAEAAAAFDRLEDHGVNATTELAVFEADHGSPARAVEAGHRAWRLTPSVRAADAYSWALSAAGRDREALRFSREAMRLGSFDPLFLYHAGIVSRRAGDQARAVALLGRLAEGNPRFSPLHGPRAEAALDALR